MTDPYSDEEIGGLGSGPRYPLRPTAKEAAAPVWYGHPSREPYDFEAAAMTLVIVCGVHEQSAAAEVIRKVLASAYGHGRDDEVENVPLPEFVEKWGPEPVTTRAAERGQFLSIAQRAETLARDAKLDPGMYPDPAEGFRWAAQAIREAVEEAWPE